MIHISVLPGNMPLKDCLSYVNSVSKLGVIFRVCIMPYLGISVLIFSAS